MLPKETQPLMKDAFRKPGRLGWVRKSPSEWLSQRRLVLAAPATGRRGEVERGGDVADVWVTSEIPEMPHHGGTGLGAARSERFFFAYSCCCMIVRFPLRLPVRLMATMKQSILCYLWLQLVQCDKCVSNCRCDIGCSLCSYEYLYFSTHRYWCCFRFINEPTDKLVDFIISVRLAPGSNIYT